MGSDGAKITSLRAFAANHTDCLLGSGWLYSFAAAALSSQSMVVASTKCCGLLQMGCTLPIVSSGFSSGTPFLSHIAKPKLFSMTLSCLQNQYNLRDSYNTKFSHHKVQLWSPPEHSFLVLTLRKHFQNIISFMLISS